MLSSAQPCSRTGQDVVQYSLQSFPDFSESKLDVVASAISRVRNMLHQAGLSAEFQALYLQSFRLMFVTWLMQMSTEFAVHRDSPLNVQHRR